MVKLNIKLNLNPNLHLLSNKLLSLKSPLLLNHLSLPFRYIIASVASMPTLSRAHSMLPSKCTRSLLPLNNMNLNK